MNLRSNKGYVLTDASVSIIILLVLVPVIMGIVYQINITQRTIETKTEAINIAINAVEAAKGLSVEELNITNIIDNLRAIYGVDTNETDNGVKITTRDKNGNENLNYLLFLVVKDYAENSSGKTNVVKTVNATVKYRAKGEDKEISLSTVVK